MRVQSIGDYFTLQGAAVALGVSYWQVWRVVHRQQTPTLTVGQTVGQTVLVTLPEVRKALGLREAVSAFRVVGAVCPECGEPAGNGRDQWGRPLCISCWFDLPQQQQMLASQMGSSSQ